MSTTHKEHHSACWLLLALVVAFAGLGLMYGRATPLFESPDEAAHITLIDYLARQHALPPRVWPPHRFTTSEQVVWFLAYHDPPLYYAPPLYYSLAAILTGWTRMDDLAYLIVPNPSWEMGWAPQANSDPQNKNIYAHRAQETWSQSNTVRAVYFLRAISVMLGIVSILCAFALARLLFADHPYLAVGAAAWVALNPQFIAISAGVTNDNLINALFSVSLVIAVYGVRHGLSGRKWALLGGVVGLGLLTKQSALLLLPIGSLAIIWQSRQDLRPLRKILLDLDAFLMTALAVGSWWYIRSLILYGDLLGVETHFASPVPLAHFGLNEALMTLRSYWAAFGWALILVEPPVYIAVGLLAAGGLAGIAKATWPGGTVWREPPSTRRGLALLALALALNVATFISWAVKTGAPYGRLLFPTISVVGVLLGWGLAQWMQWPWARYGVRIAAGLAFIFALLVPARYLQPAFASPYLAHTPDSVKRVNQAFENGLVLVGYNTEGDWQPGREVIITLYWYARTQPASRYRVIVQLGPVDPMRLVANSDVWLGGTLYSSELWQANDTVRQQHRLRIPASAPAPELYWIRIGLIDPAEQRVALTDSDSDMVTVGPWRMRPTSPPPSPTCATNVRVGSVRLLGYDLKFQQQATTSLFTLSLYWQSTQALETDYTVFVHVVDRQGDLKGQQDEPPRHGGYPTSWWLPGEVVIDEHVIQTNQPVEDAVQLLVGMYDPVTLSRLPLYDATGQRVSNDAIPLARLEFGPTGPWLTTCPNGKSD